MTDSDLDRYHAGEADGAEEARVKAHLAMCPECGRRDSALVDANEELLGRVQALGPVLPATQLAARGFEGGAATEPGELPTNLLTGYRLIREIHRGGQGIVYEAAQESTKRKVAVKLLLAGPFASATMRRRFEREIELAASLKHSNIISIFHAGTTDDGRQFCVMDYVPGVPLHQFVCDRKLALEETLELFTKVCEAVNYAHQKGVIHRDLKPSNILVEADGEPKVLDFGLAKQVLDHERTLISVTGEVVGTLPYMSPEQARGNPDEIDIRTDVYALGVLLYEILTGHYPYPVGGDVAEVLRHIAETAPTPPSRRWTSDSGVTKRSSKRLRVGECPIDDEVQTIVLRSLAKERERRYQTAGELARDVGRYLADEPIEAKRDSGWYVLRKALRRYRAIFGGAATLIALIIGAGVTFSILWRHAERDRKKAVAINEFVTEALASSDPHQRGRQDFKVTDAMDQAIEQLDAGDLEDQPETEVALLLTISHILDGNARSQEGLRLAERALELNKQLHPGDHADLAASLTHKGACLYSLGRSAEALSAYEAALAMRQRLFSGDHQDVAESLDNVGLCLSVEWRLEDALPKHEAALAMRQRLFAGDHLDVTKSLSNLGNCLLSLGRFTEALPRFEAALAMSQRLFPNGHPSVATYMNNNALCLQALRRPAEALIKYEAALEMNKQIYHGDHKAVASSLNNVAMCLRALGRPEEALPMHEAALEMFRQVLPPEHPTKLSTQIGLAVAYVKSGRFADAEPLLQDMVVQFEHSNESRRLHEGAVLRISAHLYDTWDAAEPGQGYDVKAAEWRAKMEPADLTEYQTARGLLLIKQGKHADAEPLLRECLRMAREELAEDHWMVFNTMSVLGEALVGQEEFAEAEPLIIEGYERMEPWARYLNRKHEALQRIVPLYRAWDAAEPGKGYDAKAAEWLAKLPASDRDD